MDTIKDVFLKLKNNNNKKILLLGNGFNLGAGNGFTKLDYPSLANEITKHLEQESDLRKFIEDKIGYETANIELFLEYFNMACDSLNFLNNTSYTENYKNLLTLVNVLMADITTLKTQTLSTIKDIHPNNYKNAETNFETCSENIGCFDYIFTLNYDLVLYWLILQHNKNHSRKKFKDGMMISDVPSASESEQFHLQKWSCVNNSFNVYFLHGAIHLIEDQVTKDTLKVARNKNGFQSLINLIDVLLGAYSKYNNLIVLEGSDKDKKFYIYHNEYLKEALLRLGKKAGDLIIYGCSIIKSDGSLNNDEHVWNAVMNNSKLQTIYIGIHESDKTRFDICAQKIRSALTQGRASTPCIQFFTTASNEIWTEKL